MTILALSSKALQNMISICYQYSCLWRYQYNASKCAIVTYNESKRSYLRNTRTWHIGPDALQEKEEYVHLGILCHKYSNSSVSVKHLDRKLRGQFFGLIKEGLHVNGLNPMTSLKIYKSIVIPRSLFGCAFLQSLSDRDLIVLERSHRLCLKQIQGLHIRSRTDIVLGLLGALPIQAEIEKQKLTFFGQLCGLVRDCAAKRLFLLRLCATQNGLTESGFIADVISILQKFDLYYILEDYISYGKFPNKYIWKKCIDSKVSNYYINEWNVRISTPEFSLFKQIQTEFSYCFLWLYAKANPRMLRACFSIAQLIAYLSSIDPTCSRCGRREINCSITMHILTDCVSVQPCRISFKTTVLSLFGNRIFDLLEAFDDLDLVKAMFGLNQILIVELQDNSDNFYYHVACFLHDVWNSYKYFLYL